MEGKSIPTTQQTGNDLTTYQSPYLCVNTCCSVQGSFLSSGLITTMFLTGDKCCAEVN